MKYIIVGGVAGGASTAARLRRIDEHAEIIMFEKGEYISYANCGLPYYIGNVIKERDKLFVQTAQSFNSRFNVDVRVSTEVTAIHAANKNITAVDLKTGKTYTEHFDKLVIATGAEPVRPPLPGIRSSKIFTLRNVPDTDAIKTFARQYMGGKAMVIGAGFIGLEMAENLHHAGIKVTVVEMINQVLAPLDFPIAAIAQQHLRSKGVKLLLNTAVSAFEETAEGVKVILNNGDENLVDFVLLSIGVKPDTKLAQGAGLQIGNARGIVVNEFLQTSNPDIYAVGDAIEFKNPITGKIMNTYLAGPANKQGRICADNMVEGNTKKYNGAINTAILKIFDLTAGATGMASKHLQALEIEHKIATVRAGSHASYYPGAKQMTIQIAFSPADGKLLGAQAIGEEGVDKRLDVLALLIQKQGTIYDLMELEHAYAPPYSSAKDPLNMAGFVAENILKGVLKLKQWNEFVPALENTPDALLIDVRAPHEHGPRHIPGSINIPVDELRTRMNELPKHSPLFVYCEIGLRGYLAQRMLLQNGYTVYNLSGGYALWEACTAETALARSKEFAVPL
ncbi:MAG: FAD-dependent oxidoreductase [Ferruginibacter sp.]